MEDLTYERKEKISCILYVRKRALKATDLLEV